MHDYPTLPVSGRNRETVDVFQGYNHNLRIGDGEFFDMKNMTSDFYPVLSPRGKRGVYAKPASPQGLIAKDQLCYVDGSAFVIGEARVEMGLSVQAENCPKRLVSMGAYVIIMPDKKYINTIEPEDRGDIEASFVSVEDVTFSLCTASGELYTDVTASAEEPAAPENNDLWLDISGEQYSLKRYSASVKLWVNIASTFIKIASPGLGAAFGQHDGVSISGIVSEKLQDLNASCTVWAKGDDYIVVSGILDEETVQTADEGAVTIARRMPNMDFVIESENRLWGCRYGMAANGEMVNEIYASRLGDFRNWNSFMNLSTDSYAVSCGTDGPFTGAIAFHGCRLFWKENFVHKVYGDYPANFGIQTTALRGVQKGCENSLAIVNETLFYKSRSGICAYDGALPEECSHAMGNIPYTDAVGGAHGNKYYVSMKDKAGSWHLFVFDTAKGMWHREDNLHALALCSCNGELYCIDADDRNIITLLGTGDADEASVAWMVQTGEIGMEMPDMKHISRLTLRLALDVDSEMNIFIQYDLSDEWLHVCNIRGTSLRSFSIPIRPRRCDHMKLRIEGVGMARIYAMTKTITQGSDVS